MPSPDFLNPIANPIFLPLFAKTAVLFLASFLLIIAVNRFKLRGILGTKFGQIYIGWLILIPIYLLAILSGRIPGLLLLFGLACMAVREVVRIAGLPKAYLYALWFLSLWSIVLASYFTELFYSLPLVYFTVLTFVAIRLNDGEQGLLHLSISLFASIWIIFGISHFVLLAHLNNAIDSTRSLLLLIIFAVSLSDIGAYLVGRMFHKLNFLDRYKVASKISPNKTYAGILGHVVGAGFGIYIMSFLLQGYASVAKWTLCPDLS